MRYHLVEIPAHMLLIFKLRQFIGQDLAALELCFDNQKEFNDYTTKHVNWKYACVIYTLCIIDL